MACLQEYGKYRFVCDYCEQRYGEFDGFLEAQNRRLETGVKVVLDEGEYLDICQECQEEAKYEK